MSRHYQSAIEHYVQISTQQYSDDPTADSVQWSCSVDDVGIICESVDTTGAQGCDDIHPAFIKHGGRPLHQALHMLYEYSYRHAVLPQLWTKAIITPIYKSGDPSMANSYRPISITCMAMRVMERLLQPRLMGFVDHHIHPFQYGFRPNHSTQHANYHLLNDVRQSLRMKRHLSVPVAFIDLTKAFDRVWRDGLLYQLVQKGITGRMWRWLRAFLSNRFISVASQQSTSDWYPQHYGVPQGAVLSPLLFSIFIDSCARMMDANDITRHPNATLLLFADDGAVYPNIHNSNSTNTLQTRLDVLSAWALLWKQQISLTKTVLVQFQRIRAQPHRMTATGHSTTKPNLLLNGTTLQQRPSFKYLGLHLDANLSWSTQCTHMLTRMHQDAYRIRNITQQKSHRPIHFSTIYKLAVSYLMPRWAYGLTFITNVSHTWMQQLQSHLCSVLRHVLALPRSTHMLSILIDAALLPISIYREFDILRFANSVRSLPPHHNARQKFELDYAIAAIDDNDWAERNLPTSVERSRREPAKIHSLGRTLLEIEHRWQISHTDNIICIRNAARERAMRQWAQEANNHSILLQLKLHWAPSYHLYMDTAANARLRARFRHNRIANNFTTFNLTTAISHILHPYCPICPTQYETVQHMIEVCPLYAWPRLQLRWQLQQQLQLTGTITVQLTLGIHIRSTQWTDKTQRGQTRLMLLLTAQYLRLICCMRLLEIP